ncbi:MAG: hypothetical protein ACLU38_05375 [Dysosmobacter sp.]
MRSGQASSSEAMRHNRLTVDELMEELRGQGSPTCGGEIRRAGDQRPGIGAATVGLPSR